MLCTFAQAGPHAQNASPQSHLEGPFYFFQAQLKSNPKKPSVFPLKDFLPPHTSHGKLAVQSDHLLLSSTGKPITEDNATQGLSRQPFALEMNAAWLVLKTS